MSDQPQQKLRWYQYSLRSLLLLMTAVAVFMSWVAVKIKEARDEEAIARLIEENQGTVLYDYQVDASTNRSNPTSIPHTALWLRKICGEHFCSNIVEVSFPTDTCTDSITEQLEELTHLRILYLTGSRITDSGLRNVGNMSRLQKLYLIKIHITNAGIANLQKLDDLKELCFENTDLSDEGLTSLRLLTQVQDLKLWNTRITDRGLDNLNNLNISELYLYSEPITESGLRRFEKLELKNLHKLFIGKAKAIEKGIVELKTALPQVAIYYSY